MPATGTITQILGPVVDVRFPSGQLPEIYSAITIKDEARKIDITIEAAQHLGDDIVRCVSLASTDGLVRGM
jgi:F-type H+-transporting ATPase subunit beta